MGNLETRKVVRNEVVEARGRTGFTVDAGQTVISNCPQERNPCNAFKPTPLRVLVYGA
jgi:uncharacterized protein YcgI (DUF1989 family)